MRTIKILWTVVLLISCFYNVKAQKQETFKLNILIPEAKPELKAFLYYVKSNGSKLEIDSAEWKSGKYVFKGQSFYGQKAHVYIDAGNKAFKPNVFKTAYPVFLEKGEIYLSISSEGKDAKVSRSPLNEEYQVLRDLLSSFKKDEDSLKKAYQIANRSKNEKELSRISASQKALAETKEQASLKYFYAHLNSVVVLELLPNVVQIARNKKLAIEMFNALDANVKNSGSGRKYAALLESTASAGIGDFAPDFTTKNIKGNDVSLTDFKGKYVLLDFWASWCGPCRAENPNLVKAYNRFKDDNFTIVSLSVDERSGYWRRAVAEDGLPWEQLLDTQDGKNKVGVLYTIVSIPSNFLINPEGKIIATNLRGDSLQTELARILTAETNNTRKNLR
ncbi:redoxin domain-containing protein [Pedobacter sp. AW1-32]|uniref:redoxin domain-containing protein n=1 Tax=Pedobacter sp. AW1-32 TaxID=3383026 RepID=UPI003FEEB1CB